MSYSQLTSGERSTISAMRASGYRPCEIARCLGRHAATIYRELKRNPHVSGGYSGYHAQQKANKRRRETRCKPNYGPRHWRLVIFWIKQKWSPEQITKNFRKLGIVVPSHERIYQYIWDDKENGGTLHKHLRQSLKLRRKRRNSKDSRGRLSNKAHISERPKVIENRERIGDCEIDTVMGHGNKHCIVTIVERLSGFTLIGKLKNRTVEELNKRVISLIKFCPFKVRTVTADNGTEFHGYKAIEKATGVKFYFATPYHSWERGTSENTNGLIRQYLPKRCSMKEVSQWHCNTIAHCLNTRPRKRLGFSNPWECINDA